jgi:hypothetical protein
VPHVSGIKPTPPARDQCTAGDKVFAKPLNPAVNRIVSRRREKVLRKSELDPGDVEAAKERGGHMPRRAVKSSSRKASKMGLKRPTQLMPEGEAMKAKRQRAESYEEEAEARHQDQPQSRDGGSAKKRSRSSSSIGGVKAHSGRGKAASSSSSGQTAPALRKRARRS